MSIGNRDLDPAILTLNLRGNEKAVKVFYDTTIKIVNDNEYLNLVKEEDGKLFIEGPMILLQTVDNNIKNNIKKFQKEVEDMQVKELVEICK